jgi:hypothetical protein
MNEHKCRNCGSNERYTKEVDAVGNYGPNLLPFGVVWWIGKNSPKLRIEVRGSCGLVEWFVPERFLPKVTEKFDRAG